MRVRHEVRLAVGALLALQLVTAVAGSWLLLRTGPAIRRILAENDLSLEAVEQMRGVLALVAIEPLEAPRDEAFADALARARRNVTEADEPAAIEIISSHSAAALDGEQSARRTVLEALDTLAAINRREMYRADERAHDLARAGAWALVGLALTTVALSLMLIRRVRDRLFSPLARLYRVALAWKRGERHQRCGAASMPEEFELVAVTFDRLLDTVQRRAPRDEQWRDGQALVGVLELFEGPALVMAGDEVLAANGAGLDVARQAKADAAAAGLTRVELGEGLVLLRRGEAGVGAGGRGGTGITDGADGTHDIDDADDMDSTNGTDGTDDIDNTDGTDATGGGEADGDGRAERPSKRPAGETDGEGGVSVAADAEASDGPAPADVAPDDGEEDER